MGAGPGDPQDMRAVCWQHGNCTLSRGCDESSSNAATGRPAGLLWSFLQHAASYGSKTEHKEAMLEWGAFPLRSGARGSLTSMPEWDGAWATAERDETAEDVDGEPLGFAGGLTPEARALQKLLGGS